VVVVVVVVVDGGSGGDGIAWTDNDSDVTAIYAMTTSATAVTDVAASLSIYNASRARHFARHPPEPARRPITNHLMPIQIIDRDR